MIKKSRLLLQILSFSLTLLIFLKIVGNFNIIKAHNATFVLQNISSIPTLNLPPYLWISAIIIFISAVIGRAYCSFLCPVGFIQDLARKIAMKIKVGSKMPVNGRLYLRYFILVLCLFLMVFKSSLFHYFDHFSNLGRTINLFIMPRLSFSSALGILFLLIIVVIPIYLPRWFCNTLCPTGTLFYFLSKRKLITLKVGSDCKTCNKCAPECPTNCIQGGVIKQRLCIDCFECIQECNFQAVKIKARLPFQKRVPAALPTNRRQLLKSAIAAPIGILSANALERVSRPTINPNMVTPPGGNSQKQFKSSCSACQLCVSVCPTKVLYTTHQSIPKMDYIKSYCSYECNTCLGVCTTGALSYYPLEHKKLIKMGTIKLDEKTCIPFVKDQDCAACAEHCPTGAVMTKLNKGRFRPVIDEDVCIGCGHCQHVCPVEPVRSITITPLDTHKVAYAPKKKDKKAKVEQDVDNDFPF
ncbi:MAG: 4Fe-4S dicluster domain-containing protein [Bacteriovoracaceae bacterium]|nr:4Fe-4S dicluster domain-containing protein [Bacteriovoracaceae bacterium]